jgi:putative serine protease PepD
MVAMSSDLATRHPITPDPSSLSRPDFGTSQPEVLVVLAGSGLDRLAPQLNDLAAGSHRYQLSVPGDAGAGADVVVFDPDSLDRLPELRARYPSGLLVVYDTHDSPPGRRVATAFENRVDAYLTSATPALLVAQIGALLRSQGYPPPVVVDPAPDPTGHDRSEVSVLSAATMEGRADVAPAPPDVVRGRPGPGQGVGRTAAAALVLVCLAAGAAGGYVAGRLPIDTAPVTELAGATDGADIAAIIADLEDSVVSIETAVTTRRGPFQEESTGAGTGIVLDGQGHILTNAHVVDGAESITITTSGGTRVTATLIAADATSDIAVLAADTTDLEPAPLATAGTTSVGDPVIAIGNALDLDGSLTVTQGIVSALDRSLDVETGTLDHLVQTDAAISSGNSGGPLVNARGEVIGINTAVAASSPSVQASNIGFAISIERAVDVANELLDQGS